MCCNNGPYESRLNTFYILVRTASGGKKLVSEPFSTVAVRERFRFRSRGSTMYKRFTENRIGDDFMTQLSTIVRTSQNNIVCSY